MVKLVSAFNTQYFHAVYGPRIDKFFDEHPGETIDLAGAKLTADCARVVNSAIGSMKVTFVDTEDPERERILKHDQDLVAEKAKFPKTTQLPVPRNKEHMLELLRTNYSGKLLSFVGSKLSDYLWLIIFIARHPEYNVEMPTLLCKTLFKRINQYYDRRRYAGKPVYYIRDGDIGVDVCDNPTLQFCNRHVCVPTEFGSMNLFALEDWKEPLKSICGDFSNSLGHYGRTIRDVLKGG